MAESPIRSIWLNICWSDGTMDMRSVPGSPDAMMLVNILMGMSPPAHPSPSLVPPPQKSITALTPIPPPPQGFAPISAVVKHPRPVKPRERGPNHQAGARKNGRPSSFSEEELAEIRVFVENYRKTHCNMQPRAMLVKETFKLMQSARTIRRIISPLKNKYPMACAPAEVEALEKTYHEEEEEEEEEEGEGGDDFLVSVNTPHQRY